MKLLVDHGSSRNIGDASMLQSVVANLRNVAPDAHLHVVDRGSFSHGFPWPGGAEEAPTYKLAPSRDATPSVRTHKRVLNGVLRRVFRKSGGRKPTAYERLLSAENVVDFPLRAPEGFTLGEYCDPYDALHVVGGGNLTTTFSWQLVHRASLIRAFHEQGKPVVLTGQQVGPFLVEEGWQVAADALRRATFVGVREPTESVALVRRAGVPAERTAMMGDDAFGLPAAAPAETDARLARRGIEPGRFFAVNVRIGRTYAVGHAAYLETVAGLVDRLAEAYGVPALVVPIALNEGDSDLTSGERIRERVRAADVHLLDDADLTPAAAKGVMSRALGAVGVSYHFCTFALSQGVPAVCLYDGAYYGQKAGGLAALWGDSRVALRLGGLDADSAAAHVQAVWDDAEFRARLGERSEEVTAEWHRVFAEAVGAFAPRAAAPAGL